jgi:hypothetical protein
LGAARDRWSSTVSDVRSAEEPGVSSGAADGVSWSPGGVNLIARSNLGGAGTNVATDAAELLDSSSFFVAAAWGEASLKSVLKRDRAAGFVTGDVLALRPDTGGGESAPGIAATLMAVTVACYASETPTAAWRFFIELQNECGESSPERDLESPEYADRTVGYIEQTHGSFRVSLTHCLAANVHFVMFFYGPD